MAGGVHGGGGHALGGMCGGGHVWQRACMVGGMHGRGACMVGGVGGMCGRGHACMPCTHPPLPTPRDTVGQCAGGKHPIGMHACFFFKRRSSTLSVADPGFPRRWGANLRGH